MAEDNKAAQPANTQAPAKQSAPQAAPQGSAQTTQTPVQQALSEQPNAGTQDLDPGLKGPLNPTPVAQGAQPTKKFPARSPLITNPEPLKSEEEENARQAYQSAPNNPETLPQSTIDEMNAGKRALERNKPIAQAMEEAQNTKPRDAAGNVIEK